MAQKHNAETTNAPMTRASTLDISAQSRIIRGGAFVAASWTADDPILQLGEIGYETDTHLLKVGDGTTRWSELPYAGDGNSVASVNGKTGTVVLGASDVGAISAPTAPTEAGSYVLKCVVTAEGATISWVAEES